MSNLFKGLATAAALLASTLAASAQTKITLGYTALADVSSSFVAKDKGFFAKNGLDVEMKLIALNSNIPAAMVSNSIQVGTLTPTVMLQAIDGGLPLTAIGGISRFDHKLPSLGVVARTGVTLKDPKDFIGKKIGVPGLNATVHVVISRWLKMNGIDLAKVTFVEAPFPNHYDLLKAGTLDAVGTAEPMRSRIEKDGVGYTAVPLTQTVPETETTMVYSMTPDFLAANPKALAAFRASVKEADAFIVSNPAETRAIMANYIKMPPALLDLVPLPHSDSSLKVAQIQFWIDVMKQLNMLSGSIDASKVVAP